MRMETRSSASSTPTRALCAIPTSEKIAQAIVANAALIRATAGYPSPGMASED